MNTDVLEHKILGAGSRLDTELSRGALARELTANGVCDGGHAEKIVDLLARERRGENLPESVAKVLERARKIIDKKRDVAAELDNALEAFYAAEAAKAQLKLLDERIRDERRNLQNLKASLDPVHLDRHYEGQKHHPGALDRLGSWIAGARESITLLESTVIPRLEAELESAKQFSAGKEAG